MMKAVKEILKTMTADRMQANLGDDTVMPCPNLEPLTNSILTTKQNMESITVSICPKILQVESKKNKFTPLYIFHM